MDPTPYNELNEVLDELVSRLVDTLGNKLIGVYLQGSFALGDFDEHSDADFIVVLDDELASHEVESLQKMHSEVYHLGPEWAKHLEGSYFPRCVLQDIERRNKDLWYLDNGASSIVRSDHCNTLLVRWIVRQSGVILTGPSPKELIEPIPTEMLRQEMYDVLMTWGKQILEDPSPWSNRFYQGFIVLNYARMLHDLHRGYPGTKREGAEWAKRNLEPAWSALIDRAWGGRPDPASKVKEPADPEEYQRTLKFLEQVMSESKRFMENRSCTPGVK
jgi:predicted nucleotidyltransferase